MNPRNKKKIRQFQMPVKAQKSPECFFKKRSASIKGNGKIEILQLYQKNYGQTDF